MTNNYDIFISYSRQDLKQVTKIKNELERETGSSFWMDLDGIESGEQFKKVIISAINRSPTMLFMMSTHSMHSDWALDELDFAKRKGKRLVIVAIDKVEMTDDFYFTYHKYDLIDWNNLPQRNKLIKDIAKWTKKEDIFQQTELGDITDTGNWKEDLAKEEDFSQSFKSVRTFCKSAVEGPIKYHLWTFIGFSLLFLFMPIGIYTCFQGLILQIHLKKGNYSIVEKCILHIKKAGIIAIIFFVISIMVVLFSR